MMTRRTLLRLLAGMIPISFVESSWAHGLMGSMNGFKVRYIYQSPGMTSKELIERQRSLESLDVIERVNSHFRRNGTLLSFNSHSTPQTLIYDYVFSSTDAHDQWQTMMQKNKALDLSTFPVKVSVVNSQESRYSLGSRVDRQVTIEIA